MKTGRKNKVKVEIEATKQRWCQKET